MSIKIKKAKLNADNEVHVEFTLEENKRKVKTEQDHDAQAHPDLVKKFDNLAIHFGLICELVDRDEVEATKAGKIKYPAELTEGLRVSGISIGGKDEDPGVVLTGQKTLSTGQTITVNSPFTRFNQKEENESFYPYMKELRKALDEAEDEVRAYLDGKQAADPQGKLFEEETVDATQN